MEKTIINIQEVHFKEFSYTNKQEEHGTCTTSRREQGATVRYVDNKFKECTFSTVCKIYSLDDWKFLYEVAKFIVEKDEKDHTISFT